jgi:hypothetical protein
MTPPATTREHLQSPCTFNEGAPQNDHPALRANMPVMATRGVALYWYDICSPEHYLRPASWT